MIPVIKAWSSEFGQEITSVGVQVHGGMGFVEETGAAQYFRDVRITSIYEGTNGIQAADLITRKVGRDGGATMEAVQNEIRELADTLSAAEHSQLQALGSAINDALADHVAATQHVLANLVDNKYAAFAGAFDYLMQTGYLFGAWQLGRSALVAAEKLAGGEVNPFYDRKLGTAAFYGANILPRCAGHYGAIIGAASTVEDYPIDWL